ncbi:MAG: GGDEF domain-containing protein [Eubacterium sp.]|nr:GGDEF domain-containing protein [Eubacterium sp.]
MKTVEKFKNNGIPLRKLHIITLIIAVFFSVILLFSMNITNALYKKTHNITQNLLSWRESSYDLQIASDYLTEQIRCFVVTGNKTYLDNYFKEAKETKRRETALNRLEKNHEKSEAVRELNSAMSESIHLMNREYYAARLAIEGYGYDLNNYPEEIRYTEISSHDSNLSPTKKKEAAIKYVFDDEYLNSKRRINNDMTECLDRLEDEVNMEQKKVESELSKQVIIEHILTFVLIGITLGIVLFTSILVFRPLRNCVELIRQEAEIPLKGAYEVRFLAKNYNLKYYTTKDNTNKLNYEANHDELTGLFNRRGYDFFLNNVDMETSTLMIIDLDEFKSVNDNYGHDVGDAVIKRAAKIIFDSFRSQDYVCRIGGDEFAVIMIRSDSSMKNLITHKVNLINQKLKNPEEKDIPPVSCSVGVAFGHTDINVSDLFKQADQALYATKQNGKNGLSFYEKSTDNEK